MTDPDTGESTLIMRRSDYDDGMPHAAPENLREWVPAVRLVKLIQDRVAHLPAEAATNADARNLAAVLLWCWATGRYNSWDIAALCEEEPLCHHLAGRTHPTRADLHRYRRDHEAILRTTLAELLKSVAPEAKAKAAKPVDWVAEAARRQKRTLEADQEGPG
ncbi:MAG TPA: hypothetical protein PLX89_00920 [Verrucomicrobiota bacterium]|nr:hypothetical protein [Verrucomicrobiales bacterium]HRI11538.1 hypothetical protein [Verrucomicrobiota bacterium]